MKEAKLPYSPELLDFRKLSNPTGQIVDIAIGTDDGAQAPWISCRGLTLADGKTAMWAWTDVKCLDHSGDHIRAFWLPIIGFQFDWWSGNVQHFSAWVHPRPLYTTIRIMSAKDAALSRTKLAHRLQEEYGGQFPEDPALTRFILGRKLHIRVYGDPAGKS